MTTQQNAIYCFQSMLVAAQTYRQNGSEVNGFRFRDGICSNVENMSAPEHHESLSNVKDNLIRTLPSFSGEYHYPVKATAGLTPEGAWDTYNDKWAGDYGSNRIVQLIELISATEQRWDDALLGHMTPCQRNGWAVGNVFRLDGGRALYVLVDDDDSRSPGFELLGGSERHWMDIHSMVLCPEAVPSMTIQQFIRKMDKLEALRAKATLKLAAANEATVLLDNQLAAYTAGFASQHKLARVL